MPPPFQSASSRGVRDRRGRHRPDGRRLRWPGPGWLRPRPNTPLASSPSAGAITVGVIARDVLAGRTSAGLARVRRRGAHLDVAGSDSVFVDPRLARPSLLVVGTVVGLLVLLFVRRDLTAAYVVVAGVVTGIVAALISAPISASVFGGVTGGGHRLPRRRPSPGRRGPPSRDPRPGADQRPHRQGHRPSSWSTSSWARWPADEGPLPAGRAPARPDEGDGRGAASGRERTPDRADPGPSAGVPGSSGAPGPTPSIGSTRSPSCHSRS